MMNIAEQHVQAVKKEIEEGKIIPTKSIGMEIVNLDTFLLKHKGGKTNIAELVELKEHIDNVLGGIAGTIKMFIDYHKKSPKYWGKLEKDEEYKEYNVCIDLENFISEKSGGKELIPGEYFIPNNYALADKVLKTYEKAGGDINGINSDEHFREYANWKFKNKSKAKKFVKFIDKTYVIPTIKERMDFFNIKKIHFGEKEITFDY